MPDVLNEASQLLDSGLAEQIMADAEDEDMGDRWLKQSCCKVYSTCILCWDNFPQIGPGPSLQAAFFRGWRRCWTTTAERGATTGRSFRQVSTLVICLFLHLDMKNLDYFRTKMIIFDKYDKLNRFWHHALVTFLQLCALDSPFRTLSCSRSWDLLNSDSLWYF